MYIDALIDHVRMADGCRKLQDAILWYLPNRISEGYLQLSRVKPSPEPLNDREIVTCSFEISYWRDVIETLLGCAQNRRLDLGMRVVQTLREYVEGTSLVPEVRPIFERWRAVYYTYYHHGQEQEEEYVRLACSEMSDCIDEALQKISPDRLAEERHRLECVQRYADKALRLSGEIIRQCDAQIQECEGDRLFRRNGNAQLYPFSLDFRELPGRLLVRNNPLDDNWVDFSRKRKAFNVVLTVYTAGEEGIHQDDLFKANWPEEDVEPQNLYQQVRTANGLLAPLGVEISYDKKTKIYKIASTNSNQN